MPQRSKGARIYPVKRKGKPTTYYIRDGKYFRTTGFTLGQREEADLALARYIESKSPDTSRTDISEIWVGEVLKLYVHDTPENKPSKALIGHHMKALDPFWTDKRLSDVKKSKCIAYTASRVKQGIAESTARRELKTLQAAIKNWHAESPLKVMPMVTLPDEAPAKDRVLEYLEAALMLRACRKRKLGYVERFIWIGLCTGTRHDAILNLQWKPALIGGHMDLKRGILYRRGKAEKETSKRRPPVQMPAKLLRLARIWAAEDEKAGHTHVIHTKGKPLQKLRKAWKTICTDAGLGEDVTPHTLRHTCATWNLWAGKTIWDVGGIIGADATTVQKVYGHHLIKDERKKA